MEKFRHGISKNVFVLGLVSFFNDIASEMIYPIIPIFLTGLLGVPVAIVGVIEGIAESTSSILKLFSGWLSDKARKRKPFAVIGYSLSAISKLILGFSYTWELVLTARFTDRFGKGIRTSARDALIVESSDKESMGRSFGFHRAMDTAGAVVGPLLAILVINFWIEDYKLLFLLAFIPSCIGVLLLILFVKEKNKDHSTSKPVKLSWRNLDRSFKVFLLISFIFMIGNSSDAFLILRAKDLGLSLTMVIFAYVSFNVVYALSSTPAGILSDKIGPRKLLPLGFLLFAVVYLFFGIIDKSIFIWILFPLYGIYMAMTEGVGKAFISQLVPKERSGTAFGIYQLTVGLCTFIASLIAGLMWTYIDVSAPFIFGSITAVISAIMFIILEKPEVIK
ncbi:MAG: MFS transporter [Ignavibacteriae bacterium]|nr:MFS transporter [Ignavibacteriota bacterium]